ncbi:MAG: nitronate monooxygenase [Acidobacteriota bacterium]|nr:nitronate monooxygenase [Acidobacteriota bacterium]
MLRLPTIIQGGMGAGVSDWRLARAVSSQGQLGVVSGTALDIILVRRLQMGDPGGHMRRGLERLPVPAIAERICRRYYVAGGKSADRPFKPLPLHEIDGPRELVELCLAGNFVEVFLAREGHENPVGINYLEKIQLPHLPSIYGAMLAGVDYVLMGAGIPARIPGVLDRLARHAPVRYPLSTAGASEGDDAVLTFDPRDYLDLDLPPLSRPRFLAIVSSHVLAAALVKRSDGEVDGFVVEGPTAGGHNAPPRGKPQLNDAGEPVYGERDVVDLEKMRVLGRPFWLAGGYGDPGKLAAARACGAAGVQVGTAFAFCEESGLRSDYKDALLAQVRAGTACVVTDPLASPTSFPFKVARLPGTMSEPPVYQSRTRVCDLGYLREAYRNPDGAVGYRCPAEPVSVYVSKGGRVEDTVGRKCICNALLANIGLGQLRGRDTEPGIVTSGDDLTGLGRFMAPGTDRYGATDVIAHILGPPPA